MGVQGTTLDIKLIIVICNLGEQATKLVVAEGRKVADSCTGPQRSELLRLCDETEILTNQLSDLIRRGQVMNQNF